MLLATVQFTNEKGPPSTCIDAADNAAVPLDTLDLDGDGDLTERTPVDLDGNPRFVDRVESEDTGLPDLPNYPAVVDMGALEFGCDRDTECDDGDPCTSDQCVQNVCVNTPDRSPLFIVHGAGGVNETRPFSGYVDPRAESNDGEFLDLGLRELDIVFSRPVQALGGGSLNAGSFVISSTASGGGAPEVLKVDDSENPRIRLTLAAPPPLQEWTTVQALVEDLWGSLLHS